MVGEGQRALRSDPVLPRRPRCRRHAHRAARARGHGDLNVCRGQSSLRQRHRRFRQDRRAGNLPSPPTLAADHRAAPCRGVHRTASGEPCTIVVERDDSGLIVSFHGALRTTACVPVPMPAGRVCSCSATGSPRLAATLAATAARPPETRPGRWHPPLPPAWPAPPAASGSSTAESAGADGKRTPSGSVEQRPSGGCGLSDQPLELCRAGSVPDRQRACRKASWA